MPDDTLTAHALTSEPVFVQASLQGATIVRFDADGREDVGGGAGRCGWESAVATSDQVTIEDLHELGVIKVILNNGEVHQQAFRGPGYVMLESPTGRHRIPLTEVHHFSELLGEAMLRGDRVNLERVARGKVACNGVGDIFTTDEHPHGNPRDGYQALVRFEDLTDITLRTSEYGFNQNLTLNTQPTNDPHVDGPPL